MDLVLARPPLAQRHDEKDRQLEQTEFPLTALSQVLVVESRRDEIALPVGDGLGLEIAEPRRGVAVQRNDVVVDELLDEGAASDYLCIQGLDLGPSLADPISPKWASPSALKSGPMESSSFSFTAMW